MYTRTQICAYIGTGQTSIKQQTSSFLLLLSLLHNDNRQIKMICYKLITSMYNGSGGVLG